MVGECIDDSIDLSKDRRVISGSLAIQMSGPHQICGAIASCVHQSHELDLRVSDGRRQVLTLDDGATPEHGNANLILHPSGSPRSEGWRASLPSPATRGKRRVP